MKKFTFNVCIMTLCVMALGLSSCRGGKVNGAIALTVSKVVKQISNRECSEVHTNISFKGKCNHVDKKIPWSECDKCGLHKVYW